MDDHDPKCGTFGHYLHRLEQFGLPDTPHTTKSSSQWDNHTAQSHVARDARVAFMATNTDRTNSTHR